MYEEYLEDYVYKIMAKLASRACRMFFSKKSNEDSTSSTELVPTSEIAEESSPAKHDEASSSSTETEQINHSLCIPPVDVDNDKVEDKIDGGIAKNTETDDKELEVAEPAESTVCGEKVVKKRRVKTDEDLDEELNNLNFHVMMFFLWMVVTLVNVPALMTWARNFKYSMVLKPDTSYHSGLILSACSAFIWQMDGPKRNLRYYEAVSALLFTMAVFILALGPLSLSIVNYGVTMIFAIITLQQILDKEDRVTEDITADENASDGPPNTEEEKCEDEGDKNTRETSKSEKSSENNEQSQSENANSTETTSGDCDVCSESRIYTVFKNLRDKFDFSNDES